MTSEDCYRVQKDISLDPIPIQPNRIHKHTLCSLHMHLNVMCSYACNACYVSRRTHNYSLWISNKIWQSISLYLLTFSPIFAMTSPQHPALVITQSMFFPWNEINIFITMWNDSKTDTIVLFSDTKGRFYSKEYFILYYTVITVNVLDRIRGDERWLSSSYP